MGIRQYIYTLVYTHTQPPVTQEHHNQHPRFTPIFNYYRQRQASYPSVATESESISRRILLIAKSSPQMSVVIEVTMRNRCLVMYRQVQNKTRPKKTLTINYVRGGERKRGQMNGELRMGSERVVGE